MLAKPVQDLALDFQATKTFFRDSNHFLEFWNYFSVFSKHLVEMKNHHSVSHKLFSGFENNFQCFEVFITSQEFTGFKHEKHNNMQEEECQKCLFWSCVSNEVEPLKKCWRNLYKSWPWIFRLQKPFSGIQITFLSFEIIFQCFKRHFQSFKNILQTWNDIFKVWTFGSDPIP